MISVTRITLLTITLTSTYIIGPVYLHTPLQQLIWHTHTQVHFRRLFRYGYQVLYFQFALSTLSISYFHILYGRSLTGLTNDRTGCLLYTSPSPRD